MGFRSEVTETLRHRDTEYRRTNYTNGYKQYVVDASLIVVF